MSPETEFDLEKLFLPSWAQEEPAANRYAKYTGNEGASRGFDDRAGGRRPPRRDGPRPERRGPGQGGPQGGARSGGPGGRPQGQSHGEGRFRRDDRGPRRQSDEHRAPALPLPEISITLMPDDKGVESLARQIKMSGRSFPLFDIAQMILRKPERQEVRFAVKKKPDGQPVQPLFLCAIDDTLWLSEDEAIGHVLEKHFGMFYQAEKTPTDPPKGTYTFVAQCGMSGVILGPPNYHDYQNQLHKLHAERFSRMPFEAFKARVKIVKEEAVVKKWIEEQSTKTEYVCLNVAEGSRLPSREAVEKHFREVHFANIVKPVEQHTLSGSAGRQLRSPGLQRLLRHAWEDQKRFPLQIATVLSQQFAGHGLQFFKVNRTVTHVSVARPHYLDIDATPVSDQIKRIVQFINATPRCTRRKLVETLAPTPPLPTVLPVPTPETASAPTADAPAAGPPKPPAEPEPTPEQASIIGDLHWLIHQGHVIEFASGVLECAKKPLPRPAKPPKAEPQTAAATESAVTGGESEVASPKSDGHADAPMETPAVSDSASSPTEPPVQAAVEAPIAQAEPQAEPPPEPAAT
jgi:hypothetical protein